MEDYRNTIEGQRRFKYPKLYWLTCMFQASLWFLGIAWHNRYSDECTRDFNCCESSLGRFAWIRFKQKGRD